MKKVTLIMLVAMVPFLTMAQKRSNKKASKSEQTNSNASYEFMVITGYVVMGPRSSRGAEKINSADAQISTMMKSDGKVYISFDFGGVRSEENNTISENRYKSMAAAVNTAANYGWEFVSANTQLIQGGATAHYYYMRKEK